MNNIFIKEVEKDDLYNFVYVNTHGWDETYRGIMYDDFLDKILNKIDKNVERQKEKFEEDIKKEKRFILYVDDKPAGIVSVGKSKIDEYLDSGEIKALYLLNEFKGHGYGKLLFNKGVEELKKQEFNTMIIGCLKDNPSTNFYVHMGGKLVDTKENNHWGKNLLENYYYFEI